MRLDLGEQEFAASANAQDIERAIAQGPRDDDWSLLLESGEDFLLAEPTVDGKALRLQCAHEGKALKAHAVLDDPQLQALFTSFLNRDGQWRRASRWVASGEDHEGEPTRGGRRQGLPKVDAPAIYGVCFLALIFLTALFPASWLPAWLPAPLQDPGTWVMIWFILAIPGILVAATLVKLREVNKAAAWATTIGRVTRSEVVVEKRSRSGEARRSVNLPAVRYSYQAAGQRYTGDRISIGEIADNDPRIPEILQRYRVGKDVTVYYQPDQPANSVLERDPPVGLHIIWGVVAVIAAILGGFAFWLLFPEQIDRRLLSLLPQVRHPYVFLFFSISAAMGLLRIIRVKLRPGPGEDWAIAPGKILVSAVETRSEGSRKTCYANVEYSYSVDGSDFRGSQIRRNVQLSGSAWIVRRQIEKYTAGASVDVHYNKANPAEAALVAEAAQSGGGLSVLVICGLLAWYFGTH